MGVSNNNGTPKSSILIGFSITNHPFWGTTIFGNTHIIIIYARIAVCFDDFTMIAFLCLLVLFVMYDFYDIAQVENHS